MYEAFYGLKAKPFQLNPDPRFFFRSKGHRRAMSYLEYGLSQGEGFIVITGEIGAGKTTLVRGLFKKLENENVVAAQLVSTQLDADDMLRMVCSAFGLAQEGLNKAALLKKLETFLIACSNQGKRALLVVDEAQNLTPRAVEELRMLSNYQTSEKSLLQSFLLGQPEFRQVLQSAEMQQLRQRIIASYHLGPMDVTDTAAYIEHRLTTVGWEGRPQFDESAYQRIFEFTSGIPRKINTLCDRLMLYGFLEEKLVFNKEVVSDVIDDLLQESTVPLSAFNGTELAVDGAPKPVMPATSGVERAEYALMVQKMEKMDQSLNNVLSTVRKILLEVTERHAKRVDS